MSDQKRELSAREKTIIGIAQEAKGDVLRLREMLLERMPEITDAELKMAVEYHESEKP